MADEKESSEKYYNMWLGYLLNSYFNPAEETYTKIRRFATIELSLYEELKYKNNDKLFLIK